MPWTEIIAGVVLVVLFFGLFRGIVVQVAPDLERRHTRRAGAQQYPHRHQPPGLGALADKGW